MAPSFIPSPAEWRKSSYSGNGGECVEVAMWRKSTHSTNGGNCVEVATHDSPPLDDTAHRLRHPANTRRLLECLAEAARGEREEHPLSR